jgi:hypothetical protein
MNVIEIAAAIRKQIKTAQKNGSIHPRCKIAVRTSRFSGGAAVDVVVDFAPFQLIRPEHMHYHLSGFSFDPAPIRYTRRASDLYAALRSIVFGVCKTVDRAAIFVNMSIEGNATAVEWECATALFETLLATQNN